MKQFKNLKEVIEYKPFCPFCSSRMNPGMDMVYDENKVDATLNIGGHQLNVDYENNNIISYTQKSQFSTLSGISVAYNGSGGPLHTGGVDYRKLLISCDRCQKYSYTVQLHIALDKGKIIGLVLNSESFSIEENAKLYEIKNIYTTEKTEMSTFHQHLSKQRGALDKVELPLVPFDFQNPLKTVERIKNLLVFL